MNMAAKWLITVKVTYNRRRRMREMKMNQNLSSFLIRFTPHTVCMCLQSNASQKGSSLICFSLLRLHNYPGLRSVFDWRGVFRVM
uniref:Uncharacterized protein n=1 Tax=Kalanchoe fedtschenkoi TaxID=63787 RepID=A0A7N0V3C4_KALFE